MINWHDVTKKHLEQFELLCKEKSIHRKLEDHISKLERKSLDVHNPSLYDSDSTVQQQQSWVIEIDKV